MQESLEMPDAGVSTAPLLGGVCCLEQGLQPCYAHA